MAETAAHPHDAAVPGVPWVVMLRTRLLRLIPFVARWAEISTACCGGGVCPTCVSTTLGLTVLPMVIPVRAKPADSDT